MTGPTARFDVIGDIHGCHRVLLDLLAKLGYRQVRGVWRHPQRIALFMGDLINRGPHTPQVLETVAAMVEHGAAECLLGNHEAAAIFLNTERPGGGTTWQRPPPSRDSPGYEPPSWAKAWLPWLRRRPIVLEVEGMRAVHAAWHAESAQFWRGRTLADESLWDRLADRDSTEYRTFWNLVYGPVLLVEINGQPCGYLGGWFRRPRGNAPRTLRRATFSIFSSVPNVPLPQSERDKFWGYEKTEPPLFVGHYAHRKRAGLRPTLPNLACVDFGAVFGGKLAAYRYSGEQTLIAENFVAVDGFRKGE